MPLDLWAGVPTTLIHIDGHRSPATLEPTAGVSLTAVRMEIGLSRQESTPLDILRVIGGSEPMQNDQTYLFSDIFLKFYNIIKL